MRFPHRVRLPHRRQFLQLAAGAAALLVRQFINLRDRLSRGQTTFLTLVRTCVYAGLIFFLLGPALIDKRVTKLRRPLTLLIDTSQSMGFPASAKATGQKLIETHRSNDGPASAIGRVSVLLHKQCGRFRPALLPRGNRGLTMG